MTLVAVVANPTKLGDPAAMRDRLERVLKEHGDHLLWLETTKDDPGVGQTRQALEQGAGLVCALGGDGTVRTVGSQLLGGDVPLGLLPGGTGNLLARNLHCPIDTAENALEAAVAGRTVRIDAGWVSRDRAQEDIFLVMSGIGMDAETMADTSEDVKARVGWVAYGITGLRKLIGKGFRVRVQGDDEVHHGARVRTVMVGNCGMIQGDVEIFPDSRLDDGVLDLLVFAPNGLQGWLAAGLRLARGRRSSGGPLKDLSGTRFTVETHHPVEAQIDGDAVGPARHLAFRVDEGVLPVRIPADSEEF